MNPSHDDPTSVACDLAVEDSESGFLERVMRYQDGTLRGVELTSFEVELRENADKLKLFADVQMHSAMARDCLRKAAFAIDIESGSVGEYQLKRESSLVSDATSARWGYFWRKTLVPLAVAAFIGLIVSGILYWRRPYPTTGDQGVALLAQNANIEWTDASNDHPPGSVLEPGWLRLKSGAALIEFYGGARVVLEGPAELQVVSPHEGYLKSGRISAHVPEVARGFKMRTDRFDVIDLGTEFGLAVGQDATGATEAEVHVFDGLIELRSPASAVREVSTGNAVRGDRNSFVELPSDRTDFLREEELQLQAASAAQARFKKWQQARDEFVAQPTVVWHESMTSRTLERASLIGCEWSTGRWPEKPAILFRRPADRIRLQLEEQFQQVTLLTWVRIDALSPGMTVLLAADPNRVGAMNWLVTDRGQLRLEIGRDLGRDKLDWEAVNSQSVLSHDRFGEWLFLATTFDGMTIRHYLNGQGCGSGASFRPPSLQLGIADLGNGHAPAMRHMFGAIDEFTVVGRTMSQAEIQDYYQKGRP